MAVLVSRAFLDEEANGVAFTGNLNNPLDGRFVVTVQKGESSVVSPEPGEIAERNLLSVARSLSFDPSQREGPAVSASRSSAAQPVVES